MFPDPRAERDAESGGRAFEQRDRSALGRDERAREREPDAVTVVLPVGTRPLVEQACDLLFCNTGTFVTDVDESVPIVA